MSTCTASAAGLSTSTQTRSAKRKLKAAKAHARKVMTARGPSGGQGGSCATRAFSELSCTEGASSSGRQQQENEVLKSVISPRPSQTNFGAEKDATTMWEVVDQEEEVTEEGFVLVHS